MTEDKCMELLVMIIRLARANMSYKYELNLLKPYINIYPSVRELIDSLCKDI